MGRSRPARYRPWVDSEDGPDGRTYCLNRGCRGIVAVTLNAENRLLEFRHPSTGGD